MDFELAIGSIALVPVIVALIGAFKRLGMPVAWAPWVNGALSLVGYGLMVLVTQAQGTEQPVVFGLNALIVFLAAAGFYDRYQAITDKPIHTM